MCMTDQTAKTDWFVYWANLVGFKGVGSLRFDCELEINDLNTFTTRVENWGQDAGRE